MGLYDTLRFRCPNCSNRFTEQTKVGKCVLGNYDPQEVPLELAAALNGDTVECPHCQGVFTISAIAPKVVQILLLPEGTEL